MTTAADAGALAIRQDRTHPGMGPVRRTVREFGLALITLGVIVLAFVVYQLFGTGLTEQHDQHNLAKAFQQAEKAARSAPSTTGGGPGGGQDGSTVGSGRGASLSPSTPKGTAVAHLVIPKIGLNKFVVQGTGEAQLSQGPGHYVDTPMPGQKGNVAIAGHRTTYGAPFFRLNELTTGSRVYITVPSGRTFVYEVTGQKSVSPSDVAVLDASAKPILTLTTCTPRFTATSRLVVTAALVGAPMAAAAFRHSGPAHDAVLTSTLSAAGSQGGLASGDDAAWPPTIVWGAVFVVLWVVTRVGVARTRRWRRAGTFVVGVLICIVPLWFCFENVVRLLPASV